jgi:multidrug efflux pump subunit AcrA (membrane-fusion protein)
MSPVAGALPPFLDPAPPPWAARALASILLALFAVAFAAMVLVHVPETVSAAFVLVPARGNDPVRALHNGTVTRVNVEDAQAVEQGAVLFVVASEPVGDRAAERQTLDVRIEGGPGRLANEEQKYTNRQRADSQEQRRLEERLTNLQQLAVLKQRQLTLSKEIADRMRSRYKSTSPTRRARSTACRMKWHRTRRRSRNCGGPSAKRRRDSRRASASSTKIPRAGTGARWT